MNLALQIALFVLLFLTYWTLEYRIRCLERNLKEWKMVLKIDEIKKKYDL